MQSVSVSFRGLSLAKGSLHKQVTRRKREKAIYISPKHQERLRRSHRKKQPFK